MRVPYFQVSAFTSKVFGGNPAGVCLLERWLPDPLLQRIAAENDLSETAFLVRHEEFFHLRWMTPRVEVDLCGHATLAAAFVLFHEQNWPGPRVRFHTLSGWLSAERRGDLVELDLPARPPASCPVPEKLALALRLPPVEVLKSRDYLALFESPAHVAALNPDMHLLSQLDSLGVIATAQGGRADFVSRFFAPQAGIPEDPVTGSAHCTLVPFWAERLNKKELLARQISLRGGELHCRLVDHRVRLGGQAAVYCRGELEVPDHHPA